MLVIKSVLHIKYYRLNPPKCLNYSYYASIQHFTTYFGLALFYYTGDIRYNVLMSVIFSPDKTYIDFPTSTIYALST